MQYYVLLIFTVLGMVIGWVLHKPKDIIVTDTKTKIVYDTIRYSDTITKKVLQKYIIYKRDTVYKLAGSGVEEAAEDNCFTIKDSVIDMTLCSSAFPNFKPDDISAKYTLINPPVIQRTVYIKDTVQNNKRFVLAIGPYGGYGLCGADVGIGITLGFKLKEW